jgi:uncharacterized protein (DUF488 family)
MIHLRTFPQLDTHTLEPLPLTTVGHGTASQKELADLLTTAGLRLLVDVRRYPGSRAHPHAGREALARWLPATGIRYRCDERLGGRRRLPADSPDTWWRVDAFRAYAAHMRTTQFREAVEELIGDLRAGPTVIMCSETLWWRCHRRLIADHLTAVRGCTVCHLDHRGRLTGHRVAPGARLSSAGALVYDAP